MLKVFLYKNNKKIVRNNEEDKEKIKRIENERRERKKSRERN